MDLGIVGLQGSRGFWAEAVRNLELRLQGSGSYMPWGLGFRV